MGQENTSGTQLLIPIGFSQDQPTSHESHIALEESGQTPGNKSQSHRLELRAANTVLKPEGF